MMMNSLSDNKFTTRTREGDRVGHDQGNDPTPLWIPLAVIFIFVPIMLGATIVAGYLFF